MKVFISFSSGDRKIAEKIYDRLKAKGVDSWISTRDIPAGADYQSCIVEAIERASLVVLVFSSRANASPEIAKELSLASRKVLIPARIEDVVPQGSFQYQLSNRQFVDLFEDFDRKLDELVIRIKAVVDGATDQVVSSTSRSRKRPKMLYLAAPIMGLVVIGGGTFLALNAKSSTQSNAQLSPPVLAPSVQPLAIEQDGTASTQGAQGTTGGPSVVSKVAPLPSVRTDPPQQVANPGPSDRSKIVLAMLGDLKNYDRARALDASAVQLPDLVSVNEAEAMLKDTNNSRTGAIAVLAKHLPLLGGKDAAAILSGTANYDRMTAVDTLVKAQKVRRDLEPAEAKEILDGLNNSRGSGVASLAPLLRANMTGPDCVQVLGDLSNYERQLAIGSLTQANKIQKSLPAEQAKQLLDATNNSRSGAIQLLASFLQEKMDGRSVAAVLGSTANYDRYLALNHLVQARRVTSALGPDDMEAVLAGMGNSRSEAVKLLVSQPSR
jgi:hypothetical protein